MRTKALKVLKLILKFLPVLINLLDDWGDKVQARIDSKRSDEHIV